MYSVQNEHFINTCNILYTYIAKEVNETPTFEHSYIFLGTMAIILPFSRNILKN